LDHVDHEALDRSDLHEALAAQRHALTAAANGDTATALYMLCAVGAALIAFASRMSERVGRLEPGKGALLLALVSALGIGCSYEIPGESPAMRDYAPEMSTAIAEWSDVYEACDPSGVTVAVAAGELYEELCGEGSLRNSVGCHSVAPYPTRHVLVMRSDRVERNTITHEAMHWLADCSGAFPDSQEAHDAPEVWGHDGILERTNDALGLPHD
jgi:hypothetical protein